MLGANLYTVGSHKNPASLLATIRASLTVTPGVRDIKDDSMLSTNPAEQAPGATRTWSVTLRVIVSYVAERGFTR